MYSNYTFEFDKALNISKKRDISKFENDFELNRGPNKNSKL